MVLANNNEKYRLIYDSNRCVCQKRKDLIRYSLFWRQYFQCYFSMPLFPFPCDARAHTGFAEAFGQRVTEASGAHGMRVLAAQRLAAAVQRMRGGGRGRGRGRGGIRGRGGGGRGRRGGRGWRSRRGRGGIGGIGIVGSGRRRLVTVANGAKVLRKCTQNGSHAQRAR
jgi:hypothetical protein